MKYKLTYEELRGWIEWVYDNAKIYGNARIYDKAEVYGNARIYDKAEVYGNAKISEGVIC